MKRNARKIKNGLIMDGGIVTHPTWLELAHKKLDEAVFAAYGWPSDLSVEEILERLLALNLERAGKG